MKMNIAVAANRTFEKYLYVMLTSLLENSKDQEICVYLLSADFGQEQADRVHKLLKQYQQEFCFIPIGQEIFPKELPATEKITVETYFRLALPDVLPKELDRVLYLDVDLIINQPIDELYFTDFEGKAFCACRDTTAATAESLQSSPVFEQLRQKEDFVYFNAGVLLMNLDKLRPLVSLGYFIEQALKIKDYLDFYDQDVLNWLFSDDVKIVDVERYNLFARTAFNAGYDYQTVKEQTAIIHYGGVKPWRHEEVRYELERFWWEYAKMTPYYTELLEDIVLTEINTGYMDQLFRSLKKENDELRQIVDRCMQLLKSQGLM